MVSKNKVNYDSLYDNYLGGGSLDQCTFGTDDSIILKLGGQVRNGNYDDSLPFFTVSSNGMAIRGSIEKTVNLANVMFLSSFLFFKISL